MKTVSPDVVMPQCEILGFLLCLALRVQRTSQGVSEIGTVAAFAPSSNQSRPGDMEIVQRN
jgi:hypothetical protein